MNIPQIDKIRCKIYNERHMILFQKTKKYKRDFLIIAAFLAVGGILALLLILTGRRGQMVRVRVDGETVKEFPLSENVVWDIPGANGGSNRMVIRDGQAWVEEASCPDGLCIRMGKISKSGQSVICLPNRVVVEITADPTEDSPPETDFVTG